VSERVSKWHDSRLGTKADIGLEFDSAGELEVEEFRKGSYVGWFLPKLGRTDMQAHLISCMPVTPRDA